MREDVASLERVQDLGNIELLALRLPELVGSPLSIFPKPEAWQVTAAGTKDYVSPEGIRVAPAILFLSTLL